ncbi:ATP-dependent DNA helicase RecQ [Candidatus Magnetomoraceae bacterium gMMP-15]
MINQPETILKNVFGYDSFRPLQKEVIKNLIEKNDTLVIMPTGGGKSLCFQIPALIFQGLSIVVSPLISLMQDQVEQLSQSDVPAVVLNSSLSLPEYRRNVELIRNGRAKLLYIAPESLLKKNILAMLSSVPVDCFAIDEAHCISQWGHDFRPEYRQLIEVRNRFPSAVCIALTATATLRVREDIKSSLCFQSSNEFIGSFNRENLFIEIVPKENPTKQTIDLINKFPNESGIIYCFSRKQVESLYNILKNEGFSVKPYHAGLSPMERSQNQNLFIRDNVRIIVATIAFGMGIDKPNVRFVVHYDLPKNIESYYQEIGRAGRDGLKSHCLLLYDYSDIAKIKYFISQKSEQEQRVANIHLAALLGFAETEVCRRIPLLKYFGENYSLEKCNMCDNCLAEETELVDITIPAQKFLSCVKRTGEKFGANHIVDVLRGSQSKKVLKFGHNNLSTYAIGKEYSKRQWIHFSRQFISKGLMTQDMTFGSLALTQKAWDVFKGKEKVFVRIKEQVRNNRAEQRGELKYDLKFFEILRKKRKELADTANVPPYSIFPDKTLIELAFYFPHSKQNFLNIHGVGEVKLKKYSHVFLDLILNYCKQHNINERPQISNNRTHISDSYHKARHIIIGEAYNSGKPISAIMNEFKIKLNTVISHLFKYQQEGNLLTRPDELLSYSKNPLEEREKIISIFKRLGPELLKPVFEALDGEIPYDDLHILRLYYLSKYQIITLNHN